MRLENDEVVMDKEEFLINSLQANDSQTARRHD